MLVSRETGRPVRVDKDGSVVLEGGKRKRFGTMGDYDVNDLNWINNFLKDYISKATPVDDTTTYTSDDPNKI